MRKFLEWFRRTTDLDKIERTLLHALCGVHILLALLFLAMGILPLVISNIIAIVLYHITFFFIFKKLKDSRLARMVSLFWIIQLHSIWGTVYLGWDYGFYMYCICTMPIAIFVFYLVQESSRFILQASVMDLIIFLTLIALRSLDNLLTYDWLPDSTYYPMISALFTALCCTVMMVFFSALMVERMAKSSNDIKRKNEELDFLANYDMLTKLKNRRNLETHVREYMDTMSGDESLKLTMALGDIDDFKKINDTYGHVCGDYVLSRIGEILNGYEEKGLISGRWGGEEMLVVSRLSFDESFKLVEELRKKICDEEFLYEGKRVKVSMTFGIRAVHATDSYDSALADVDRRLYYGKAHGKNRVCAES